MFDVQHSPSGATNLLICLAIENARHVEIKKERTQTVDANNSSFGYRIENKQIPENFGLYYVETQK